MEDATQEPLPDGMTLPPPLDPYARRLGVAPNGPSRAEAQAEPVVDSRRTEPRPPVSLGLRSEVMGAESLRQLRDTAHRECIGGRGGNTPLAYPALRDDENVICGLDRIGDGREELYVCGDFADMEVLYRFYFSGAAMRIMWYLGNDPGFITALRGDATL